MSRTSASRGSFAHIERGSPKYGEVSLNSVGFAPKGGVGFAVGPDGVIMRFELVE